MLWIVIIEGLGNELFDFYFFFWTHWKTALRIGKLAVCKILACGFRYLLMWTSQKSNLKILIMYLWYASKAIPRCSPWIPSPGSMPGYNFGKVGTNKNAYKDTEMAFKIITSIFKSSGSDFRDAFSSFAIFLTYY